MTFLVSPQAAWNVGAICALGGAIWTWLEFRRPNRRQWLLRVVAAVLAALALLALGLRPAETDALPNVPPVPEEAALWTPAFVADTNQVAPRNVAPERHFALPGAKERPADAIAIPDVAFLAREYPNVKTLHIFGDGVSAFDADALRPLRVVFHSGTNAFAGPAISFVRLPAEVCVGDPIVLQGRVQGIEPGTSPVISLSAPDGTSRTVPLVPAPDGNAIFALSAAPAVATGRYVWQLELRSSEVGEVLAHEDVGVSVIQPTLPRILLLEASPRFDTGRLKRWLGEHGAEMTIRTQLGRDRVRITTMHGARDAVESIDSGTLAAFDLVLADASVLAALGDAERDALRTAINENGLGLLIVADETLLNAAEISSGGPRSDSFFFPWKLLRGAKDEEADERLSRLHWSGSDLVSSEPLPVPNYEIERAARVQPLVRDGQNRTLVARAGRGRGRVALTLVSETWRWAQLRDPARFAAYWSFLFSELARRDSDPAGRWSILSEAAGPHFVNEPVLLRWSGSIERAPFPARVLTEGDAKSEQLALAQNPDDSSQWHATYWPRRAGWHQVSAPGGGATMDFFVSESKAWQPLQAMRRQAATTRMAATFVAAEFAPTAKSSETPVEVGRWWFFAVLFACLTYLWSESRTLRTAVRA